MRRTFVGLIAATLFLGAARLRAACATSENRLCMNGDRFSVEVSWRDFRDRTGVGHAVPITSDTGYFWFFSPANVELVVKVLDARSVNGKYWVFFGALSNVEYTLTVTDTTNGKVKTYVNPSGQFASVGDTKAFDPAEAGPASVSERVAGSAAPPASLEEVQAFIEAARPEDTPAAPCPTPRTALFLSGCRFRVEVSWEDGHGRTGEGFAVPVTGDTGYFWFFSPANVELMVKALDARSVNGKFWVFFGALSNVEYTLTVTDQVTGEVRSYANASGRFASVGDTAAFASGYSVAPAPDEARASAGVIGPAGGTLTAEGADGTHFTLVIPPEALPLATRVTLTPLSRLDRLPFSGGLKGAVQLGPDGLLLFAPAALTIRPSTDVPKARLTPFAYRSSGEELILYPYTRDADGLHLPVAHFSGYGAGDGSAQEQADQTHRTPSGPLDRYVQEIADIQRQVDREELDPELGKQQVIAIVARAYEEVILPRLKALTDCNQAAIVSTLRLAFIFLNQVALFNEEDLIAFRTEIFLEVKRIALHCIDEMYRICKENDDLFQIPLMLGLTRALSLAGVFVIEEELYVRDKVIRCASFELDFDATFTFDSMLVYEQSKYQAEKIPIALDVVQGDQHFILRGEGPIRLDFGTFIFKLHPQSLCDVTVQGQDSTFTVRELSWDMLLATQGGPGWQQYDLIAEMEYDPGTPAENDHIVCPGFPDGDSGFFSKFAHNYELFHTVGEKTPSGYFAFGWKVLGSSVFATRDWPTTSLPDAGGVRSGTTHMAIRHTPK
jgi:hypothetical protein